MFAKVYQPSSLPPLAQQIQQVGRKNGVAMLTAFATFDPEHHALAVNIMDL